MADGAKAEQEKKKGGKRGLLIAAIAVVVLAAGGGGAWYMLGRDKAEEVQDKPAARKAAVFVDLDPFTVNLADPGGERFAQIGLVLEVPDGGAAENLKREMPRLRNGILLLLSSKTGDELLTVAGKQALAEEIGRIAGGSLGWEAGSTNRPNPVSAVHFSKFIVQ